MSTSISTTSKTTKHPLTPNLINKINKGIKDAKMFIASEMKYSEDLRNNVLLNRYKTHISKMETSLEQGYLEM